MAEIHTTDVTSIARQREFKIRQLELLVQLDFLALKIYLQCLYWNKMSVFYATYFTNQEAYLRVLTQRSWGASRVELRLNPEVLTTNSVSTSRCSAAGMALCWTLCVTCFKSFFSPSQSDLLFLFYSFSQTITCSCTLAPKYFLFFVLKFNHFHFILFPPILSSSLPFYHRLLSAILSVSNPTEKSIKHLHCSNTNLLQRYINQTLLSTSCQKQKKNPLTPPAS